MGHLSDEGFSGEQAPKFERVGRTLRAELGELGGDGDVGGLRSGECFGQVDLFALDLRHAGDRGIAFAGLVDDVHGPRAGAGEGRQ